MIWGQSMAGPISGQPEIRMEMGAQQSDVDGVSFFAGAEFGSEADLRGPDPIRCGSVVVALKIGFATTFGQPETRHIAHISERGAPMPRRCSGASLLCSVVSSKLHDPSCGIPHVTHEGPAHLTRQGSGTPLDPGAGTSHGVSVQHRAQSRGGGLRPPSRESAWMLHSWQDFIAGAARLAGAVIRAKIDGEYDHRSNHFQVLLGLQVQARGARRRRDPCGLHREWRPRDVIYSTMSGARKNSERMARIDGEAKYEQESLKKEVQLMRMRRRHHTWRERRRFSTQLHDL